MSLQWEKFLSRAGLVFEGAGDQGAGETPAGNSDTGNADPGGDRGTGDRQFSQADIDRFVGDARKDAKRVVTGELLKELGFDKADDLKAAIKTLKEAEEAKKSDLEKAQSKAEAAEKKAAEKDTLIEGLKTELDQAKVEFAVLTKAAELGFSNPQDALALLDTSGVKVEEGKVTGFEKGLDDLAKSGRLPMREDDRGDRIGTPRKPAGNSGNQNRGQGGGQSASAEPIGIRL